MPVTWPRASGGVDECGLGLLPSAGMQRYRCRRLTVRVPEAPSRTTWLSAWRGQAGGGDRVEARSSATVTNAEKLLLAIRCRTRWLHRRPAAAARLAIRGAMLWAVWAAAFLSSAVWGAVFPGC